jgi:nucleotide-binding universal stress UspA family protein
MDEARAKNRIVVGIDGSEPARRALAWAFEEADLRGADVVAVHAWTYPVAGPSLTTVGYVPQGIDFAEEARQLLECEIKEVTGGTDYPKVERRVVEGSGTTALLRESQNAGMLVIGSRGLGGFAGLLLGSVGHQCAQHASCPVVIIPHER